jgi:hypothetical protein
VTLLATEIIPGDDPVIVFAADRRISLGTRRHAERPKVLRVPSRRAGIGYFGLAEIQLMGRRRPMDLWLGEVLERASTRHSLGVLAAELASSLNAAVPLATRRRCVSGFHLAGLNDADQPEFWFVRNVADDRTTITGTYAAREDFQRRDRARLPPGSIQIYRNGDVRAHAAAWEAIDQSFGRLLQPPDFNVGARAGPVQHMRWVQFKMETIAHFYQRFCRISIIGKPVDALAISRFGVLVSGTRNRWNGGAGRNAAQHRLAAVSGRNAEGRCG